MFDSCGRPSRRLVVSTPSRPPPTNSIAWSRSMRARLEPRASGELVGELGLAPCDVRAQLLVDRVVDRRRLVVGQPLLPDRVGALRRVEPPLVAPLLAAGVGGDRRPVERLLEVRERVGRAEEVHARLLLAERVE